MDEGSGTLSGLNTSDHDLLIRLNVIADMTQAAIAKLSNDHAAQVTATDIRFRALEMAVANKADRSAVEQLQAFRWWLAGGVTIAGFAGHFLLRAAGF